MIYSAFLEGDFTVKHTANSGSGASLDQAFEEEYNKSAKGPSGIIGYTRRKESVLKWNIIHHEKRHLIYIVLTTRVSIPFIMKFRMLKLKETRYV